MAITNVIQDEETIRVYSNDKELFTADGELKGWNSTSIFIKTPEGEILLGENGQKL